MARTKRRSPILQTGRERLAGLKKFRTDLPIYGRGHREVVAEERREIKNRLAATIENRKSQA